MAAERSGREQRPPTRIEMKIRRAIDLLLFRHRFEPGVADWELRRLVGKDYEAILKEHVNPLLAPLGLEVVHVVEPEKGVSRWVVRRRKPVGPEGLRLIGWRIDTLAALAGAIALIVSNQGRMERRELEERLEDKFGPFRTRGLIDHFIRVGYLYEDEMGTVMLGWRTRVEIPDIRALMQRLLTEGIPGKEESEKAEGPTSSEAA